MLNDCHIEPPTLPPTLLPGFFCLFFVDCQIFGTYQADICEAICKQPGIFVSKNGACVNILAFSQQAVDNSCDPKKGVLAYLLGDPQFGRTKLLCLSIDPGVQPDNLKDPNTICEGGTIDINYIQSFPQLYSCKCPDDQFLATIQNTSVIRQRGVCVNKKQLPIYKLNKLVYDKTDV